MHDPHDTIAAIASAPGGAARGIVRVSGPDALVCVQQLRCEVNDQASLTRLSQATRLECDLRVDGFAAHVPGSLLVWPTARSYTRQPLVEIHTVGSPPLLQSVLRTLCRQGARLAAPGEFTLRAFLAGRLDLTQAEAVLGVIDSHDRRELDVALTQLAGGLGRPLTGLRDELLEVLAHLEAGLDFVEEDIEFISRETLRRQIVAAAGVVRTLAERTSARAVVHDVVRIVLIGAPNVGKSSLFNALLKRSAAIVSPLAGTTRDYLVGELMIDGVTIELVDTAGVAGGQTLEEVDTASNISREIDSVAQSASLLQRQHAAVELLCLDATRRLVAWEREQLATPGRRLIALTKSDQPRLLEEIPGAIPTSSAAGIGLNELCAQLRRVAQDARTESTEVVATTAARCHDSLRSAATALAQAVALVDTAAGEELVAAELRAAIDELGHVVGAVYTEDLLDRIFSRFCIGK